MLEVASQKGLYQPRQINTSGLTALDMPFYASRRDLVRYLLNMILKPDQNCRYNWFIWGICLIATVICHNGVQCCITL